MAAAPSLPAPPSVQPAQPQMPSPALPMRVMGAPAPSPEPGALPGTSPDAQVSPPLRSMLYSPLEVPAKNCDTLWNPSKD